MPINKAKELYIKRKKLKNPYVLAPMCQYMAKKGKPTEWHYQHLGRAIVSGFAKIMIESTSVSYNGRITDKDLCLYNESQRFQQESMQIICFSKENQRFQR